MKIVKVILSPEAEEVYRYLNSNIDSKTERMILKAVNQKVDLIKMNPHYGDPIAKNLIPPEYEKRYGVTNLFRVELPNFWRMIYTLTHGGTNLEIVSFVLDIMDHKDYNKKFGYRKC
jgi:hypothetical protein